MNNAKRTMTLNLTDAEMSALEQLSERKDLSKTAVLRQALRLYQLVDTRVSQGEKLFFEDELNKKKSELMVW
jgi:predicted transcriptional regulator